MAFQIRRGLEANLGSVVTKEGELLYAKDTKKLYVGNTQGTADLVSAPVTSINGFPNQTYPSSAVTLTTDNINESLAANNLWYTVERAQDAAASLFTSGTHSGITFTYGPTQDGANRIDATVTRQVAVGDANIIGSLPYYDTANTISYTNNLSWNSNTLTVTNGLVELVANNSNRPILASNTYSNDAFANAFTFRKARGSSAAPSTVLTNDAIGVLSFNSYTNTFTPSVRVIGSVDSRTVTAGRAPGLLTVLTQDANDGQEYPRFRVTSDGRVFIGPYFYTDGGTGSLYVRSASDTTLSTGITISARNASPVAGAGCLVSLSRLRGSYAAAQGVQAGDTLAIFRANGWDGTSGTAQAPITTTSSAIEFVTDSVSTGKLPGSIYLKAANTNGILTTVLRINVPTTSTSVGTVTVSGTIASTNTIPVVDVLTHKTTITSYAYDASSNIVTLAIGDTVDLPNFSGSVLVNCHNSGTVTQYLVGGGIGSTAAIGSSKGSPTGTMAFNEGIGGYTFTATEAGPHSFYVIRTRTGA